MCDVCGYDKCPAGCPGAAEHYGVCVICGSEIIDRELFVDMGRTVVHLDCLSERMKEDAEEALDVRGHTVSCAGE